MHVVVAKLDNLPAIRVKAGIEVSAWCQASDSHLRPVVNCRSASDNNSAERIQCDASGIVIVSGTKIYGRNSVSAKRTIDCAIGQIAHDCEIFIGTVRG